jgi:peptidoglycan/xylan/chitin deacetylase (PgdA/CDA1 family)
MNEDNAGDRVGEGRLWPERNAYAPDREAAPWPDGKRLAVYVAVGVEDYVVGRRVTEDILPDVPAPDLVNASWRAYGLRVGGPRLLDRLHQLGVPITILLNSAVYDSARPLIEQARRLGAELVAHGEFNSDSLDAMSRDEEKAYLQQAADRIQREEGRPPLGWSSPWLTHTPHTLDLLTECGYRYLLGLRFDDQPVWLDTGHGPLLAIPYSVEINDSSAMIGRNVSAKEFADRILDEFTDQLAASADTPLVMSVILHSFISGVPFRLHQVTRAIERLVEQREAVWFARPCDIYDHLTGRAL